MRNRQLNFEPLGKPTTSSTCCVLLLFDAIEMVIGPPGTFSVSDYDFIYIVVNNLFKVKISFGVLSIMQYYN